MAKDSIKGLAITGRLKESGITLYTRNGRTVVRTATSRQPKRRTQKQFAARQQLAHSCRLWAALKRAGTPLIPNTPTAYARFLSLMRPTPIVYVPCRGPLAEATLLLPGMPVSEGTLPAVQLQLAEVNGQPALICRFANKTLLPTDTLLLYTLRQTLNNGFPEVHIGRSEVPHDTFVSTADGLALVAPQYADPMCGWALVHQRGNRHSSQTAVTSCTYYKQFTTEEALQEAAASYGGLTAD